jgi:nucleoside-diphosphate-sugar epimerase
MMIGEIENLLDKKVSIIRSPMNSNDVDFTSADTTYLESLIGKRPTVRIEQGLSEVINWSVGKEVRPFLGTWARSVG